MTETLADHEVERIARVMHEAWREWAKRCDPGTYRDACSWEGLHRHPNLLRLEALRAVARAVIDDPGKRM